MKLKFITLFSIHVNYIYIGIDAFYSWSSHRSAEFSFAIVKHCWLKFLRHYFFLHFFPLYTYSMNFTFFCLNKYANVRMCVMFCFLLRLEYAYFSILFIRQVSMFIVVAVVWILFLSHTPFKKYRQTNRRPIFRSNVCFAWFCWCAHANAMKNPIKWKIQKTQPQPHTAITNTKRLCGTTANISSLWFLIVLIVQYTFCVYTLFNMFIRVAYMLIRESVVYFSLFHLIVATKFFFSSLLSIVVPECCCISITYLPSVRKPFMVSQFISIFCSLPLTFTKIYEILGKKSQQYSELFIEKVASINKKEETKKNAQV